MPPPLTLDDIALAAMQGLLANGLARLSIEKTARRKSISFYAELAHEAYDMALAMEVEAGNH